MDKENKWKQQDSIRLKEFFPHVLLSNSLIDVVLSKTKKIRRK